MSDATFATVSSADYPALRRLMPGSVPDTYERWVSDLYGRMVRHRGGSPTNRTTVVEIDPAAFTRSYRGNGSGQPGLTDIDNYAHSLGRSFVDVDPDEFLRLNGTRPGAR